MLYKNIKIYGLITISLSFSSYEAGAVPTPSANLTIDSSTATGFFERTIEYDWSVNKTATPTNLVLALGQSGQVQYTVKTTRTALDPVDVHGVSGQICATNDGTVATTELALSAQVLYQAPQSQGWQNKTTQSVDITSNPILDASESNCYPYRVEFTPVAGEQYQVILTFTLTNQSGHLSSIWPKSSGKIDFTLPFTPVITYRDRYADLVDVQTCPDEFTCTPDGGKGSWTKGDDWNTDTVYNSTITNDSGACNSNISVNNTVTLTERDNTTDTDSANAQVAVSTQICNEPAFSGCTYSQGYWKNHDTWPVSDLSLGTKQYSKDQLLSILNEPVRGNGAVSLAKQLIAAKLNHLKPIDPAQGGTNYGCIVEADKIIGDTIVPPTSGGGFINPTSTSAVGLCLDQFNNGGPNHDGDYDIDGNPDGPSHCSDETLP